jgi:hypothetical protein
MAGFNSFRLSSNLTVPRAEWTKVPREEVDFFIAHPHYIGILSHTDYAKLVLDTFSYLAQSLSRTKVTDIDLDIKLAITPE